MDAHQRDSVTLEIVGDLASAVKSTFVDDENHRRQPIKAIERGLPDFIAGVMAWVETIAVFADPVVRAAFVQLRQKLRENRGPVTISANDQITDVWRAGPYRGAL